MKKLILISSIIAYTHCKAQYCSDTNVNSFITYWIGKPYIFGGSSEKGIDCSAFAKKFYEQVVGFNLFRTCYEQWNQTVRIPIEKISIGDLLFFKSSVSPSGWHVGVYIGNDQFIHSANRKEGVKISCLQDPIYKRTYKGAGRINKG